MRKPQRVTLYVPKALNWAGATLYKKVAPAQIFHDHVQQLKLTNQNIFVRPRHIFPRKY